MYDLVDSDDTDEERGEGLSEYDGVHTILYQNLRKGLKTIYLSLKNEFFPNRERGWIPRTEAVDFLMEMKNKSTTDARGRISDMTAESEPYDPEKHTSGIVWRKDSSGQIELRYI
jgi:hypothetical protein